MSAEMGMNVLDADLLAALASTALSRDLPTSGAGPDYAQAVRLGLITTDLSCVTPQGEGVLIAAGLVEGRMRRREGSGA